MSKIGMAVVAVLVVIALTGCGIAASVLGMYNGIVGADQDCKAQWGNVQAAYQRRADLIPNIVNTVKGFAEHEKSIMADIANARAAMAGAQTPEQLEKANQDLGSVTKNQDGTFSGTGVLGRLLVVMENYPNLKADQLFGQLTNELEGSENRINYERNRSNEFVRAYNDKVVKPPSSLVAGFFGFRERPYFQASAGSENAPTVDFGK